MRVGRGSGAIGLGRWLHIRSRSSLSAAGATPGRRRSRSARRPNPSRSCWRTCMRRRCGSTAAPRTSSRCRIRWPGWTPGDVRVCAAGSPAGCWRRSSPAPRRASDAQVYRDDGVGAARRRRGRRLHDVGGGQAGARGHRGDRRRLGWPRPDGGGPQLRQAEARTGRRCRPPGGDRARARADGARISRRRNAFRRRCGRGRSTPRGRRRPIRTSPPTWWCWPIAQR